MGQRTEVKLTMSALGQCIGFQPTTATQAFYVPCVSCFSFGSSSSAYCTDTSPHFPRRAYLRSATSSCSSILAVGVQYAQRSVNLLHEGVQQLPPGEHSSYLPYLFPLRLLSVYKHVVHGS